MSLFESYLFTDDTPDLAKIINNTNGGVWEIDLYTMNVRWSIGFYKILGYEPGEIECSYQYLIDHLLYYDDKSIFLESLNNSESGLSKVVDVRLFTKSGYKWYQSTFQKYNDGKLVGTLINIHNYKISQLQLTIDNTFVTETSKLVKLGRWRIAVATNKLVVSKEVMEIFELQQKPNDISQLYNLFLPHYRALVTDAINDCITIGRPFDVDIQMETGKGNLMWAKMKAVAQIDEYGKCFVVKGIVQDISPSKQNENDLKSSLNFVSNQNKRLENFAHIVSHNLRSYIGNLQIMVNLHKETNNVDEQVEIFSHIKTISTTLSAMIEHLNEIVQIDLEKNETKTIIEFELLFKSIINALQSNIQSADAVVEYDFSKCPTVKYLPAYLESIFHNLLTNAIKYRHPERQVVIKCVSKIEDNDIYIIFEDNGMGIDLDKYGSKIFGMYETFHRIADSQGIGLYITRNQIEALGGTISVESTVDVGTKFIIKLTSGGKSS
jgi:signal transduction histidine kinase